VLDKFRHKLPKDELKRFGKDISKKLVSSDYKNNRVEDPSAELSERQAQKIKKYVKEFLDKAVVKYNGHQDRKLAQDGKQPGKGDREGREKEPNHGSSTTPADSPPVPGVDGDSGVLTDADNGGTPSDTDRKRKRDDEDVADSAGVTPSDSRDLKRLREEGERQADTPPPPPPPPAEAGMDDVATEEQRALREQEEDLMRENEEAQRLEDEASKTQRMEHAADEMKKDLDAAGGPRAAHNQEVMSH
jgi:histone-lysine N-methyltransferase SETD2